MTHTKKWHDGYRYYVYLGPGAIEYFETWEEAIEFHEENGDYIGKKKATFLRTLVNNLIGEVDNLASLVRRIK